MYPIRDDLRPQDVRPASRPGPDSKYPLAELKPGQHFAVPLDPEVARSTQRQRLYAAVWRFQKHHPERRFAVRCDVPAGVVRVFRVEDAHD